MRRTAQAAWIGLVAAMASAAGMPGVRAEAAATTGDLPKQDTPSPVVLPGETSVDPQRFGARPPDAGYGAFQRGLYITAYNLAVTRAQNGDPAAQTLVAEILSRGLGMARNEAEAAKWYQRASEQGIPEAQFQYALMLLDGR